MQFLRAVRGISLIFLDLFILIFLAISETIADLFRKKKSGLPRFQNTPPPPKYRRTNAELEAERKFREKIINKSIQYQARKK